MPRNIEIKARVVSVEALLAQARALADGEPETIDQDDTFFAVAMGRLKLREIADGSAELIHYHRADGPEARPSDYVRVPVADAAALREALARGCGVLGRVRKRRLLLRLGPTRLHLDRVEGLGDFVELEVVLREASPTTTAVPSPTAGCARSACSTRRASAARTWISCVPRRAARRHSLPAPRPTPPATAPPRRRRRAATAR
jgi:adenylate cyclase class IV